MPFVPSMLVMMLPSRTQEMKCGRYTIVCTPFLNFMFLISLSRSAKVIGTMMFRITLETAMTSVFHSARFASGIVQRNSKFSKPTHGEPNQPLLGLKFWNAMTIPTIGTIENIKSQM